MTDEPFDLTPFVKMFDLTYKANFKPVAAQDGVCEWSFPFPSIDLSIEFENASTAFAETMKYEQGNVIKMHQRGKYWFDRAFEADVIMKSLQALPDGSYTAAYDGTNIIDKTDYRPLARFLRWILRR